MEMPYATSMPRFWEAAVWPPRPMVRVPWAPVCHTHRRMFELGHRGWGNGNPWPRRRIVVTITTGAYDICAHRQ